MRRRSQSRIALSIAMGVVVVFAGACGGDSKSDKTSDRGKTDEDSGATTALKATEKDFSISLDKQSVPAGTIKLTAANEGAVVHEFVAFRTDLGVGDLPLENGSVNEKGAGITHIDPEAEDIEPGTSKQVTLHLNPGRYVVLCNVPGHYKAGMSAELTVS